jgi:hypothetical protein
MIFLPSAKFLYRPQTTVAPWTPLSLTNAVLYGWYKADAGVPVSTDGASVATWADQSTNDNHLAQATTANQGVFRTAANGINGIPVLEFPSSAVTPRFIQDTAFLGSDSDGFSFYIVSRNLPVRTQYGGAWMVGQATAGGISQMCDLQFPGSVAIRFQNGSGDWVTGGVYGANYNVTKVSCGSSINSYKHKSTYVPAQNQPSSSPSNTIMGAGFRLGMNYYGSVGSRIAEVIVCKRELDAAEEIKLNTYLRSRYGFDLNYGADIPVTGAALWLDASRMDTLFTDNLLTTAATTDNGPIGGWKDLSGNNRHALQTFTNRPTWRTPINGLNGLGMMSFNGSSQWLDIASFPSLASGYTFYAVLKQPTAVGAVFSAPLAGTTESSAMLWAESTTTSLGVAQWGSKVSQTVSSGSVVAYIGKYDGSHTTGNYFVHTSPNTSNTVGTMTQNAGTPAAGTARVGRATEAQTYYFNSNLYELVVLPRQSDSTEDQAWKTYTAAKWGITWS